jgi:hypothetical protein
MRLPHGVRRIGSQATIPVRIVVAFEAGGSDRLTRCTAGFELLSSHTKRYRGFLSFGQSTIWSVEK